MINQKKESVCSESICLTTICFVDAILTIAFVGLGLAQESNPIMNFWIHKGYVPFFVFKMMTVLPAVAAAELYRKYNPVFVRNVLRFGIYGYLIFYIIGLIVVNFG